MEITLLNTPSPSTVEDNQDILFIIDDNDLNSVESSLTRGGSMFNNLISIKTKKDHRNKISSMYSDKDFDSYSKQIRDNFIYLKIKMNGYNKICLPENGFGRGLKNNSPKLYKYLSDLLRHNLWFDNDKSIIINRIPSFNEMVKATKVDISNYQPIKNELIKHKKSIGITNEEEYEIGDVLKLIRKDVNEELIVVVNINSYNIDDIDIDDYNLLEGYTKSNNGKFQCLFEYIGSIDGGVIKYADDRLNRTDDNIKHINRNDTIEVKPIEVEIIESGSGVGFDRDPSLDVITKKIRPNTFKILSILTETDITSILEVSNMEYLILDTKYFYRVKDYEIIDKIDMIEFDVVETLGKVFLYIKERVLDQDRVISMEISHISKSELLNFLNGE